MPLRDIASCTVVGSLRMNCGSACHGTNHRTANRLHHRHLPLNSVRELFKLPGCFCSSLCSLSAIGEPGSYRIHGGFAPVAVGTASSWIYTVGCRSMRPRAFAEGRTLCSSDDHNHNVATRSDGRRCRTSVAESGESKEERHGADINHTWWRFRVPEVCVSVAGVKEAVAGVWSPKSRCHKKRRGDKRPSTEGWPVGLRPSVFQ